MSLYLKYRPKDFESLVGQDFIRDTLRNAIVQDKLVGAYLFTGPRGTGKTSTARIFALAINCPHSQNGNPCFECDICKSFMDNKLIDIIEIDAASHTGVDNVREIIEKAQFSPNRTKYKVYIIDEVHMLSKGAFNALLKILEEPPSHVKFILATTEIQKVPETILSRCQRYDFRSIDNASVKNRVQFIAQSEGVSIDEKSLNYIMESAAGGLRNAINLFEQLIKDGKIEFETLVQQMGVTPKELMEQFYEKLLQRNVSVIHDFESITGSGKNIKLFFKDLIYYVKNSLVTEAKTGKISPEKVKILEQLDETYGKTKYALDEGVTFLTGILKILAGDTQIFPPATPKSTPQKTQTQTVIQPQTAVPESITKDDVVDIFSGDSGTPEAPLGNTPVLNGDFDKAGLLDALKHIGASGAIIASLKESEFRPENEVLHIIPKNKFSRMSLEKHESISMIQQALDSLGKSFRISFTS